MDDVIVGEIGGLLTVQERNDGNTDVTCEVSDQHPESLMRCTLTFAPEKIQRLARVLRSRVEALRRQGFLPMEEVEP